MRTAIHPPNIGAWRLGYARNASVARAHSLLVIADHVLKRG
jgi:hypothetical protein